MVQLGLRRPVPSVLVAVGAVSCLFVVLQYTALTRAPQAAHDERLRRTATRTHGDQRPDKAAMHAKVRALQRVSFFVYSGPEFAWLGNCSTHPGFESFRSHKHAADIAFVEQVQDHPWRVDNPDQADVFVIPLVLSFAVRSGGCGALPVRAMLQDTAAAVSRSSHYQARPQAHLILCTDWKVPKALNRVAPPAFLSLLSSVVFATQIHDWQRYLTLPNIRFRCTTTVPMMPSVDMELGNLVRGQSAPEFARRDILIFFQGQADHRRAYRLRRLMGLGAQLWTAENASPGRRVVFVDTQSQDSGEEQRMCQCSPDHPELCVWCTEERSFDVYNERLAHAQFSLHIRGDLPGSNRIYGLVAFGTVPVVVSDDVFSSGSMPFEAVVPWEQMTVRVAEKDAREWKNVERAVAAVSPGDVEKMRSLLHKHAPDVLWTLPGNRVIDNLMREVASVDCSRVPKAKSAMMNKFARFRFQ